MDHTLEDTSLVTVLLSGFNITYIFPVLLGQWIWLEAVHLWKHFTVQHCRQLGCLFAISQWLKHPAFMQSRYVRLVYATGACVVQMDCVPDMAYCLLGFHCGRP